MSRADRLTELVEQERELRKQIADAQVMTKAVDGARIQLENGLNEQAYATQAISGQVGIVKQREKWLIDRQDDLQKKIEKLRAEIGMTTMPGDAR